MLTKRLLMLVSLLAITGLASKCTSKDVSEFLTGSVDEDTPTPTLTATPTAGITPGITPGLNPGRTPGLTPGLNPLDTLAQGRIKIPATADTYTNKLQPEQTAGSEETFYSYENTTRVYIQFLLTGIPKGATITNATLSLNIQSNSLASGNDLHVSLFEQTDPSIDVNNFNWNNQPYFLSGAPVDTFTLNSYNAGGQQSQDTFDITNIVQYYWGINPGDLFLNLVFAGTWTLDISQEWYSLESGMGPALDILYTAP